VIFVVSRGSVDPARSGVRNELSVAVELFEPCDALVGGMQRQIAEAVDQLDDGRRSELVLTQDEAIPVRS
jgi:hypothetical protein